MIDVACSQSEYYSNDSEIRKVLPNKKYAITTSVIGISGQLYCGYFGVILYDDKTQQVDRKIQWLNDFSGAKKDYSVVLTTPNDCVQMQFIYRINIETPIKSACKYAILPPGEAVFSEADPGAPEVFDSPNHFIMPRVEELSPEKEAELEKNIIWILGARRSGTTWLGQQLLSYRTNYLHEPNITDHLAITESGGSLARRIDARKKVRSYFFSQNYKNTWLYYLNKLILYRIHAHFQDLSKKIVVKEPTLELDAFDIIAEALPQSKFILIVRDGRDVIDSHIDARQEGGWQIVNPSGIINKEDRMPFIRRQSEMWVKEMESLIKTYESGPMRMRFLVKYEDLRAHTFDILREIYKFVEIDISDEELKKLIERFDFEKIPESKKGSGKFYRSATPGLWRERFSQEEKNVMWKIMGNMLTKFGYSR